MTRTEAKMIAQELYKLFEPKLTKLVSDVAAAEMDEWLNVGEAARLLGWSKGTLYNKIEDIPHTKCGNRLRFKKSTIIQYMDR